MRLSGLSGVPWPSGNWNQGPPDSRPVLFREHHVHCLPRCQKKECLSRKECLEEKQMRLSWAGKEATDMVILGAPGRCPGGSVIPSITHVFPKQTQWKFWGGGAGQARVSEKVTVLVLSTSLPPACFPVSFAFFSAKFISS